MSTLIKAKMIGEIGMSKTQDDISDEVTHEMLSEHDFYVRQISSHWYEGDPNQTGHAYRYHSDWLFFLE